MWLRNCAYKLIRMKAGRLLGMPRTIVGIETSCDDTACAVVNSDRLILGECVKSYPEELFRLGGIIPTVAKQWHEESIEEVVQTALQRAKCTEEDIDAIAVTNRPGLILSLLVGLNYAQNLAKQFCTPVIPIHHMEAHTLTARLFDKDINYPFLTLLISGGHCLIALVESVNQFKILGRNTDDAPGEVLDKIARRLKLHNLAVYRKSAGGAAIEDMAKKGNYLKYNFGIPFGAAQHCDFSFSGFKSQAFRYIAKEEVEHNIDADQVLPNACDICASVQLFMVCHIIKQLHRAMEFIDLKNMLPSQKRYLVVSGGAASNYCWQRAINLLCEKKNYQMNIPPAKYCSDNGVMIAWNGIEKFDAGIDILKDPQAINSVRAESRELHWHDLKDQIVESRIKCDWLKVKDINNYLKSEIT